MRVLFFERRIDYMIRMGLFLCCLIFCFLLIMLTSPSVFAEGEPQPGDEKTLTVTYNGETVKVFTAADLEAIAEAEGNQQYFFSAYNTYPSFKTYPETIDENTPYVGGPTILGILADAGLSDTIQAEDVLVFSDLLLLPYSSFFLDYSVKRMLKSRKRARLGIVHQNNQLCLSCLFNNHI